MNEAIERGARARYERYIKDRPHFMTWDELGPIGRADECQAFAAGLKEQIDWLRCQPMMSVHIIDILEDNMLRYQPLPTQPAATEAT